MNRRPPSPSRSGGTNGLSRGHAQYWLGSWAPGNARPAAMAQPPRAAPDMASTNTKEAAAHA
eukprot:2357246-Prorocentrum_lima.AAC.1